MKKAASKQDIFIKPKADRRLFVHVPDPEGIRAAGDRRLKDTGKKSNKATAGYAPGLRFEARFPVLAVIKDSRSRAVRLKGTCVDISQSGILVEFASAADAERLSAASSVTLRFQIPPGVLPEGMESRVKLKADFVRRVDGNGMCGCGLKFKEPLESYVERHKDRSALTMSAFMLFFVSLVILLMRTESLLYFRFNKVLYLYSIMAAVFLLSRYFFGALYRPTPVDPDYTPGVSIIIPCFNEEEWIGRTIRCCVDQDYPVDKLEVIVVNDCSTDNSQAVILNMLTALYNESSRYLTRERIKYIEPRTNRGKREALALGAKYATHDLLVFVDSDSFLAHDAIRNLVQPFRDPKVGGVSGRTDVANTYTNGVTKMQAVRYYIAFRIMKAAESYFDAVTCLSGPLACYRKSIVMEHMDEWLGQRFLGQRATFGDDRSLTNFVLRKHRTAYQDTAICATIVPNTHQALLKQQMRWKRSWLRESIIAGRFIWKKEPFMSLFFYIGLLTPVLAPVVVVYNLIYVPIAYGIFPLTFLMGLLLMSLMMSFAQLFFRRSSIWFYGFLFCVYYEFVLLWQMPVAWFTFWKSTWGTRMTPADVKAQQRKEKKIGRINTRKEKRREKELSA
ncbi:MAG TPA: glycosyltransferase [Feifaniaceae bacterium]|nr:glycosyltransferase [Feifaniaceae bacterium]